MPLLIQYDSLVNDVMATNAAYLGISVGVVLALGAISGVIVYLSAIKPYQKSVEETAIKLKQQQNDISQLIKENKLLGKSIEKDKNESNLKISELTDQLESLSDSTKLSFDQSLKEQKEKFESLFSSTQQKLERLEWDTEWNLHYLWDSKGVHYNTVSTLLSALEKAMNMDGAWRVDLVLDEMELVFKKHLAELEKDDDWGDLKKQIVEALDKMNTIKSKRVSRLI